MKIINKWNLSGKCKFSVGLDIRGKGEIDVNGDIWVFCLLVGLWCYFLRYGRGYV